MGGFLTYLSGLKPKNKLWACFGPYGWGGGAVKAIKQEIQTMKAELSVKPMEVKYRPDGKEIKECFLLGEELGRMITNS